MSGKSMLYELRKVLSEDSSSIFINDFLSYKFLWEAAVELALRVGMPQGSDTITTVASQAAYDLSPGYMGLYLKDRNDRYVITYNDGSVNHFPVWLGYDELVLRDQSANSVTIPSFFSMKPKETAETQITGSASANGAVSNEECTLTVAASAFSEVHVGDEVYNTTDGSMGIVTEKVSNLQLKTALFNGTNNDWTSGDSFIIQPYPRFQLLLEPPPSTAAHTATVRYRKKPDPVFSGYRNYMFPFVHEPLLVKYAAWLYKYKDQEPNYGDKWYVAFDSGSKKMGDSVSTSFKSGKIKVNFKARH